MLQCWHILWSNLCLKFVVYKIPACYQSHGSQIVCLVRKNCIWLTLSLGLYERKIWLTFFMTVIVDIYILLFMQKNPTRCNTVSKFIIPYLYEAQHVSGDTPPIIRSLKLHWQPLVLHTWKVVGHVVAGHCLTASSNHMSNSLPRMQNQRLPVQF